MGNAQTGMLREEEVRDLQSLRNDDVHRKAAALPGSLAVTDPLETHYKKNLFKSGDTQTNMAIPVRPSSTVSLLHTMLSPEVDLASLSSFILSWLTRNGVSFQLNTVQSKDGNTFVHEIYGYLFQDTNYTLFKMDYFRRQSDLLLGIDVQQLEGEGFILGAFVSQLFASLRREFTGALASVESSSLENETDEDEDFCYSDDEEEISTDKLDFTYLQLHRSPKLITTWIGALESNKITYPSLVSTLILFAHNCQYEPNLKLILETVSPIRERFLNILLSRMKDSTSLPIVYSCSKILYSLFTSESLLLTWKDVASIATVLTFWSTERPFSLSSPVTTCLPVVKDLVFVLNHCALPDNKPQPDEAEEISILRDMTAGSALQEFFSKL